jgi:hypothetical protein
MRQYESEWNNLTRVNNSLQRQLNDKLEKVQTVEDQIRSYDSAIARAKGVTI